MDPRWVLLVVLIGLLAGAVGGALGAGWIAGAWGSRMMSVPMMMSPQMMVAVHQQIMNDPQLRQQMLEMHRQMHALMEQR